AELDHRVGIDLLQQDVALAEQPLLVSLIHGHLAIDLDDDTRPVRDHLHGVPGFRFDADPRATRVLIPFREFESSYLRLLAAVVVEGHMIPAWEELLRQVSRNWEECER